jgi:hypothetical protein
MRCLHKSRSFKWTVHIREIVVGQFFEIAEDLNPVVLHVGK